MNLQCYSQYLLSCCFFLFLWVQTAFSKALLFTLVYQAEKPLNFCSLFFAAHTDCRTQQNTRICSNFFANILSEAVHKPVDLSAGSVQRLSGVLK